MNRWIKLKTIVRLVLEVCRGRQTTSFLRYTLAEYVSAEIFPGLRFSEYGSIYLEDREFIRLYESLVAPGNNHSFDRKYVLDQLCKLALAVPGDTAECGSFRGATSHIICRKISGSGRKHHVFDSFEGLSAPGKDDGVWWVPGSLSASEDTVRHCLRDFDFVEYYKGWIPERFSAVRDRVFSLVHVDVDLYQPTLDSVAFFYDRMSPGGLMLFDDYGFSTCPGAKKAVDEFFARKNEPVILLPTGQAFAVKK